MSKEGWRKQPQDGFPRLLAHKQYKICVSSLSIIVLFHYFHSFTQIMSIYYSGYQALKIVRFRHRQQNGMVLGLSPALGHDNRLLSVVRCFRDDL